MLDAGFLTLVQLKEAILPEELRDENSYDSRLQRLGKGVAVQMNGHCARTFERAVGGEYEVTADRTSISLPCYPIETVTQVDLICKTTTTEITADLENLLASAGILQFGYVLGTHHDRVKVTYTGGYWLDDGGSQPAGSTALPWDVMHAFEVQCQAVVEHTNILGTASARTDKEGRGGPAIGSLDLLDITEKILKPYRRFA